MADAKANTSSPGAGSLHATIKTDLDALRVFAIVTGVAWAVLFIVVGLWFSLQMYGDGAIFSYSIAVMESWAYHWHNIPDRLFAHGFSHLPAERYVELTGHVGGGIMIYGFLQFVAPLAGLALTWAADHSARKVIFSYACCSTAVLCPLVFGCPTEMWMAHALFWPTLAICHYADGGWRGAAAVFTALLALAFTHPGGLVLGAAILVTLSLRGLRDPAFLRAVLLVMPVIAIRAVVKAMFPPDGYMSEILSRAAFNFIDVTSLTHGLFLLLAVAVSGYGLAFLVLRRFARGHVYAAGVMAIALAIYWLWFDRSLHTDERYALRTALLAFTPILGGLATVYALDADGRLKMPIPYLPRLMAVFTGSTAVRLAMGALAVIALVHAVETAKFATAWTDYKAAIRILAMGTDSDPELGDPRFVSTARISAELNRLSWFSTTEFLSILVAPGYAPSRLVLDPDHYRFLWLSCATATATYQADRAIPAQSRDLVRAHACAKR